MKKTLAALALTAATLTATVAPASAATHGHRHPHRHHAAGFVVGARHAHHKATPIARCPIQHFHPLIRN